MTKAKLPWIRFEDACVLMYESFPAGLDAEQILAQAIKSGILSVRGKLETFRGILAGVENDIEKARRNRTSTAPVDFTHARSKKSPALKHLKIEATWYAYDSGFFAAISLSDPQLIEIYSNIEIKQRDLSSFLNKEFYWPTEAQDGRRRSDDLWLAITCALIRLERDKWLNNTKFPTAIKLREAILTAIDGAFDERTVRTSIDALYVACVTDFDGTNWEAVRGDDVAFNPVNSIRTAMTRDNSKAPKLGPG